jgi:hypothetical protein
MKLKPVSTQFTYAEILNDIQKQNHIFIRTNMKVQLSINKMILKELNFQCYKMFLIHIQKEYLTLFS